MHYLKKLFPALVILTAFAVLLTGVGFLRPLAHVARCQIVLRKPVEEVWPTVSNLPAWPTWFEQCEGMRRVPQRNGHDTFLARESWGEVPIEIERLEPPYELVTYQVAHGVAGRRHYTLEIVPAGTQLTITEYGEVENPFLRGLAIFSDESGTIKEFMRDLAKKLELKSEPTERDLTLDQYQQELAKKKR